MSFDNGGANSNAINFNSLQPEKSISKAFEDVLPVEVSCYVVLSAHEIKEGEFA